jgi:deoxyguanosine kinase
MRQKIVSCVLFLNLKEILKVRSILNFALLNSMKKAFLCLGGNLGDRIKLLQQCRVLIAKKCGKITNASSIYETAPWGSDSKHAFLNQVVQISTSFSCRELHKKLQKIEFSLGKKRTKVKNADRTMDIDILFFGNEIIDEKDLVVPHPRIELRKFVLKPLNEIAAKFKHPVSGKSISELLKNCADDSSVLPYKKNFYLCVEGNIGSGKTTLAKALAKKLKAKYLPEEFEENPYLELFYKDPEKYAFDLEYSFFLDRVKQLSQNLDKFPLIVSDYSIHKCLWFAKVNLKKREYGIFKKQFHSIVPKIPQADLLVHLSASTPQLLKNIKKRGRVYEQSISGQYLEKIDKTYEIGLKGLDMKVVKIQVKDYTAASLNKLVLRVKEELS